MRPAVALAIGSIAAAVPVAAAAKPPAGPDDRAVAMYRLQGVGACVAAHPPGAGYGPDARYILADCECAIDRFIAGRDVATLPRIVPGQDKGMLDEAFAQCRAERRGERPAPAAKAAEPAAEAQAAAPAVDDDKSPGFDPLGWIRGLDIPSLEVPRWIWGAVAALVVLLVGLRLLRRRRRSDDLMGPPPSMRQGKHPRSTWPIERP